MRVFRICRPRWANNLSGSGVAGRWNNAGARIIYTSSSLALALLEILVHVELDQVPDYVWMAADVPKGMVEASGIVDIPPDSSRIGTEWLARPGSRVALRVPSVIVPESNILLNPDHTDFPEIHWNSPASLMIDSRLLRVRSPFF